MNTEKAIKWLKDEIKSLKIAPAINGCEMTPEWREQMEIFEMALQALEVKEPKNRYNQIRNMSVEEMARVMLKINCLDDGISFCQNKTECNDMLDSGKEISAEMCLSCLKQWLLQEVNKND